MEQLSERKSIILEVMDQEIEKLEAKLKKVQPLIDELAQLKRARATLLSERTTTGSVGARTQLTMETMIHSLRANANEGKSPSELAEELGVDQSVIRSHLNRYRDQRYRQDNGKWFLIGKDTETEDEEEDE